MDEVLLGIPYTFVYLDDILVASETAEQHQEDLKEVLQRLKKFGLVLNHEKCVFNASQVEFLSMWWMPLALGRSQHVCRPSTPSHSPPQSGSCSTVTVRRFLSGAASILNPLTDATRGEGDCQTSPCLDQEMQRAFTRSKAALAQAAELIHPDPTAEISLAVDASDHHAGGVLQQGSGSTWAPLAFFSRKLSEAEARYSTFNRELLACVAAIWRTLALGLPTRLISSRFVWPGLATDVKECCRECVACQCAKVTTQPSIPVEKISIHKQWFSHVHMDLVGPWLTACAGRVPLPPHRD